MTEILNFSESLFDSLIKDPSNYIGKAIDISGVHKDFKNNLNWDLLVEHKILSRLGISKNDLIIAEIENKIRASAQKANMQVVVFDKDSIPSIEEIVNLLLENRILLLR